MDEILNAFRVLERVRFFVFLDNDFQAFIEEGLGFGPFQNRFHVELDFGKDFRIWFEADLGSFGSAGLAFFEFALGFAS